MKKFVFLIFRFVIGLVGCLIVFVKREERRERKERREEREERREKRERRDRERKRDFFFVFFPYHFFSNEKFSHSLVKKFFLFQKKKRNGFFL